MHKDPDERHLLTFSLCKGENIQGTFCPSCMIAQSIEFTVMWVGRDERKKEKGQKMEMEGKRQKPLSQ